MGTLGSFIKERRMAAGMTQKQLASKIGKAEITVRQYERGGRTPDLETKIAIANALNFAYDDFLHEVDIEVPEGFDDGTSTENPYDDPNYAKRIAEELESAESGYYDVGTRQVGDRIVNELFYYPPSLSLNGLTEEDVKHLREYRDFLIWRRMQKQQDNN